MGLDIEAAFNKADTDHSGFIGKFFLYWWQIHIIWVIYGIIPQLVPANIDFGDESLKRM